MASWLNRLFNRSYYGRHEDNIQLPPGSGTTATTTARNNPNGGSEMMSYLPMPKESISLRGMYSFQTWKAVGLVQWFFVLGYCLNGVIAFLSVANAFLSGNVGLAILAVIFAPLYFLLATAATRVLAELAISVLMIPHLMLQQSRQQQEYLHFCEGQNVTTAPIASSAIGAQPYDRDTEEGVIGGPFARVDRPEDDRDVRLSSV